MMGADEGARAVSPITFLHLRMFPMAADYCKHSNSEYEVVGGYVLPGGSGCSGSACVVWVETKSCFRYLSPVSDGYKVCSGSRLRGAIGLETEGLTRDAESRACAGMPSVCSPQTAPRDPQLTACRVRMCELAVEHAPFIMVDPYEAISVGPPPPPLPVRP